LEEAIAAGDEAVAATARDRACYHADLAAVAVEEMTRAEVAEEQAHVVSGGAVALGARECGGSGFAGGDGRGAESPMGLDSGRGHRMQASRKIR
jgi:hypothetical protein